MAAERSVHSSAAFFHSEPQLDLLAPCGMMPKEPIGGLPLMLRAIMPRRKGSQWKKAALEWTDRSAAIGLAGEHLAWRENYMDLDPSYTDKFGDPLLRFT